MLALATRVRAGRTDSLRAPRILFAAALLVLLAWKVAGAASHYGYESPGTQDYIEYWSAGQALSAGENPFDPAALAARQNAAGRPGNPILMWNPPWLLAWVFPIVRLPFAASAVAWFVVSFALLAGAALVLASAYWPPAARRFAPAVALAFAPSLLALQMGQMSVLLLVGLTGFLACVERRKDFAAGAFLALTTMKPHYVHLVLLAAGLWALSERRWRFVAGAIFPVAAGALAVTALRPTCLLDFVAAYTSKPPTYWFPDTLGGAVRHLVAPDVAAIQFVPGALAALGPVAFAVARRPAVSWKRDLPALVTLSACTSAYGWSFDQVVLLVPVFALLARAPRIVAPGALLISLGLAAENVLGVFPPWNFWGPFAVLVLGKLASLRIGDRKDAPVHVVDSPELGYGVGVVVHAEVAVAVVETSVA